METHQTALATASSPTFKEGSFNTLSTDLAGNLRTTGGGGGGGGPVTIADGADVCEGTTTDSAVVTDSNGTLSGKLRGIIVILLRMFNLSTPVRNQQVGISTNEIVDSSGNPVGVTGTSLNVNITNSVTSSTNVAQFGGSNVVTGVGISGAGIPRVTISSDSSFSSSKSIKTVTGSVNSNTLIVTAVASKKIKVTGFSVLTSYSAGAISPKFTDGNAGTTLWLLLLQAISGSVSGANLAKSAPDAIFATTAGNGLYFDPNGQSCTYSVSYFDDDAT